jgi:aminoglycoside phosphotransferase (APT) family kinase protein
MHVDEVDTDVDVARRLVRTQFPQWADLAVAPVDSFGTDHAVYRLGDELAVRLPRIAWAAGQAERDARWLPVFAPRLPLRVPLVRALGEPSGEYPFRWSVAEWLPGDPAHDGAGDTVEVADALAAFVRALRRMDTAGAHLRSRGGRGAPLAENEEDVRAAIGRLDGSFDTAAIDAVWQQGLDADPATRDRWIHGDLLPGNLLLVDGRLSAVIDFGGLNVGDPACELQAAWNVFTGPARERYLAGLGVVPGDATWRRGRAWVVCQTVMALPYYRDTNPAIVRQASFALQQALDDAVDRRW